MKNKGIALLGLSGLICFSATATAGLESEVSPVSRCGNLTDYTVARVSFPRITAREAAAKLLAGTPLQAAFAPGTSGRVVSAKGVSGNLEQVLAAFGKQAGLSYSLARCVITFSPKTETAFSVEKGDVISERLATWLAGYGFTLAWEAAKYQATAGMGVDDGFEETLSAIKDSLKISGVNITIQVYDNNVVRVTEAK